MIKYFIFSLTLSFISCVIIAQAPDWTWLDIVDGGSDDRSYAVAADNQGNSVMGGRFWSDTLCIEDSIHISEGECDIYLVKYDSTGNILWSRSFGGERMEWVNDICFDQNGHMYITGLYESDSILFDSILLFHGPGHDGYLAILDLDGKVIHAESFGGPHGDEGKAIVTDDSGNYYLAGQFKSPEFQIQDTTLYASGTYTIDVFVAKFSPNHEMEWISRTTQGGYNTMFDMSLSPDGFLYVSGTFRYEITFGPYQLTAFEDRGLFLAKYDTSGNVVFAKNIADFEGYDWAHCNVCNDNAGNVLVSGCYSGSQFILNGDTLINKGDTDIFICKFDSDGNPLWLNGAGENYTDKCHGMVTDNMGNVYIEGSIQIGSQNPPDTLFFSENVYVLIHGIGFYIAKYTPDGDVEWAKTNSISGEHFTEGEGIAIDPFGNLYAIGWYMGNHITFGPQTYYSTGWMDAFIVKLDQNLHIRTVIDSVGVCGDSVSVPVKVSGLFNVSESNLKIDYDTSLLSFQGYTNFSSNIPVDSMHVTDTNGTISLFWRALSPTDIGLDTLVELLFNAVSISSDSTTIILLNDTLSYYADTSGINLHASYSSGAINLLSVPPAGVFCQGTDSLCQGQGNNYVYYGINTIPNATGYSWDLLPDSAGTFQLIDNILIVVNFSPSFYGTAQIIVNGINDCGIGDTAIYPTMVIGTPNSEAGESAIICENSSHALNGSAFNTSISVWTTTGDGTFDDPFDLNAIYSPGPEDILTGEVYLVLYAFAIPPCIYADADSLLLTIRRLPYKPQTPYGPTSIILDTNTWSEYYSYTVSNANAYQWFLDPPEAGTLSSVDTNAIVYWNLNYTNPIAQIYIEALNNCGTTVSDSLLINFNPVNLPEEDISEDIIICPNPSDGIFKVVIPETENDFNLILFNAQGYILIDNVLPKTLNESVYEFDLSDQPAGLYYLLYNSSKKAIIKKLIFK